MKGDFELVQIEQPPTRSANSCVDRTLALARWSTSTVPAQNSPHGPTSMGASARQVDAENR